MRRFWSLLFVVSLYLLPLTVLAQTDEPTPTPAANPLIPLVHTVQDGENLTIIATNYGITVVELLALNNLTNADVLSVGQQLVIPGGEGEAVATFYTVQAGDTINQIASLFNTTAVDILSTNHILNQMYQPTVGDTLTVISQTGSALPQAVTGTPHIVTSGETLLTIAARNNLNPAALAAANDLAYPTYLFPGQRLRLPSAEPYADLPGEWKKIQLRPLPIQQGSTVSIYVENLLDGTPSGSLAGQPLRFFPSENGYVALVGIDAFTEPGVYDLQLAGSGNQPWFPFQQQLPITSSGFGTQLITISEELSDLLNPAIRQEEDDFLATIYNQTADSQAWEGLFQFPVTSTIMTAPYGDGRSYNEGPVEIYHTGVDFAGGVGTPILAPANGAVVFADTLELRGQTVVVDHGLGVMTAYFHLSEIFVTPGEQVTAGQLLAAGGSTGLSTGPHLHWDVRVNNIPVNGLQWTEQLYP